MDKYGFSTKSIHSGNEIDINMVTKAKTMPIYETSVFEYDSIEQVDDYLKGNKDNYMYTRLGNPNQRALEELITSLEEGEAGAAFSSGMAAISAVLLSKLSCGDHMISTSVAYGGTTSLLKKELERFGIEISFIELTSEEEIEKNIKPNTKLIYSEIASNPLVRVANMELLSLVSKKHGLKLVIDNTFMTPILYQPLKYGAHMVVHSTTKYINGHSDATGGLAVGEKDWIQDCKRVINNIGAMISPFEAWLTYRGAKTLAVRMERHSNNATEVAKYLQSNNRVNKVFYPALKSHPDYYFAKDMFHNGFGGMMSFEIENNIEKIDKIIKGLKLIKFAPSLAGIATTISHPAKTSHRSLTQEQLAKLDINLGTIRLSVGIEDVDDIISDLDEALKRI